MKYITNFRAWLNGAPTLGKKGKESVFRLQIRLVYQHVDCTLFISYSDLPSAEMAKELLLRWYQSAGITSHLVLQSTIISRKDLHAVQVTLT